MGVSWRKITVSDLVQVNHAGDEIVDSDADFLG